jgi:hypothetical protein
MRLTSWLRPGGRSTDPAPRGGGAAAVVFTRALARDFRALFARCSAGRPRGPAPPVVVRVTGGVRTLAATTADGVVLTHATAAQGEPDGVLVLPGQVLAEVEGGACDPVRLTPQSRLRATLSWAADGKPRALPVELILPGKQHELPHPPPLAPVPPIFLAALHECGRTAARDSGRFALSKVQVQGRAGRVVGTDGKTALLWGGFKLPFADDLLVPVVEVFGSKELARGVGVRVGRSPTHLVVAAGPWAVWLPADTKSRFPDVAGVVPRHAPTTAGIDERDAAELLGALSGLPGTADENRPVTLDADRILRVRARDDATGRVKEVTLVRSPTAGPPTRVAVDRRVLGRALALGCHTLRLAPDKPLVFEGDGFTLVAAGLDPDLAVPPGAVATRSSSDDHDDPHSTPTIPERRTDVRPNPTSAQSQNGRTDPPPDPGLADPLAEAEQLRVALADAAAIAGRLVALLKTGRKEKRALAAVRDGLNQLNLGGGPR